MITFSEDGEALQTVFPVCMLTNDPQMNTAELSSKPVMMYDSNSTTSARRFLTSLVM